MKLTESLSAFNIIKRLGYMAAKRNHSPSVIKLNDIPNKFLAFPKEIFVMPEFKDFFGKSHKFFEEYSIQMPDFYLYNLPNGYCIANREEIWTENRELVIDHTTQVQHPLKNAIIPFEQSKRIKGKVFHLSLSYDLIPNYWHWLVDCLSRIAILKKANIEPDFYVISNALPFQKEWLKILGIKKDKIIESGEYLIQAENLIFTTLGWGPNNYETVQYVNGYIAFKRRWLPKFVAEMYKNIKRDIKAEKNIFVSRANSSRRRVVNENGLTELLQKYDYIIVDLDKISVAEQIEVFGQAKKIIGVHGAGLANILFAPTDSDLLEIYPYGYYDSSYRVMAVTLGINYNYIIGEEFGEGDPQKRDIFLDKEKFESVLRNF